MKRNGLLLVLALLFWQANAQDRPDARERIEAARAAYITERLGLTPAEAERFWPVYREFDARRTELRQQLRDQRRQDPGENAEEQERQRIQQDLELRQKELDLNKEYTDRLLKTIPAQKLRMLKRAEEDYRNLIIQTLQQRRNREEQQRLMRDRIQQRPKNN